MRRITLWALSTLTTLVLLFSYHTSTSSRSAAATAPPSSPRPPRPAPPPRRRRPRRPAAHDAGLVRGAAGSARSSSSTPSSSSSSSSSSSTVVGRQDVRRRRREHRGTATCRSRSPSRAARSPRPRSLQVPWNDHRDQEINSYAVPVLNQEVVRPQSATHRHGVGRDRTPPTATSSRCSPRSTRPTCECRDRARPATASTHDGSSAPATPRRAFVEQVMGLPVSVHVRGGAGRARPRGRGGGRPGVVVPARGRRAVQHLACRQRAHAAASGRARRRGRPPVARGGRAALRARRSGAPAACSPRPTPARVATTPPAWSRAGRSRRPPTTCANVPGISWCVNAGGDLVAGAGRDTDADGLARRASRTRARRHHRRLARPRDRRSGHLGHSGPRRSTSSTRGPAPPSTVPVRSRCGGRACCGPTCGRRRCSSTPTPGATALAAHDPAYRSFVL